MQPIGPTKLNGKETSMISSREQKEKSDYSKLEKLRLAYKAKKKVSKATKVTKVTSSKASPTGIYSSRNRSPDYNHKANNTSVEKIPKLSAKRNPIEKLLSDLKKALR